METATIKTPNENNFNHLSSATGTKYSVFM